MSVTTRVYTPNDAETLFTIFVEAIHEGAAAHYTHAQRMAWAPNSEMSATWPARLAALEVIVAESDDEIAGFMAVTSEGYIDSTYVRPRWMGRSVAQALYDVVLERAHADTLPRMTTHASLLARPFFAKQGWQVDEMEIVDRNGEQLKRFAMSLTLGAPHDTAL